MPEQTLMQPQSLVRLLDFFCKKGMQKVHLTPILQAKRRLQLHSCKRRPKSHWRICSQGRGGALGRGRRSGWSRILSSSGFGVVVRGRASGWLTWVFMDFFGRLKVPWNHNQLLTEFNLFERVTMQGQKNKVVKWHKIDIRLLKENPSPLPQKKNITSQQLPFMLGWLYDAVPVNSPKLIILYQSPPENSWFLFPKLPKRIYLLTYCWGFILNWPSLLCVVFVHSLFQTSLRNPPIHPHLCKGRAMAFQESKVRTWIKVYILGES